MWVNSRATSLAVLVLGALVGAGVDRMPAGAFARGTLAMVLAWNLSLYFCTVGWLFASPFASETYRESLITREALWTTALAAVVATILHLVLKWDVFGLEWGRFAWRTHAFGVVGAAAGAIQGFIARASEEFEEA